MYILDMKNDANLVPISKAISMWRKKRPSLVKKTVLQWVEAGLVSEVVEVHGHAEWHTFTKAEVRRVHKLLKATEEFGVTVFPRPSK